VVSQTSYFAIQIRSRSRTMRLTISDYGWNFARRLPRSQAKKQSFLLKSACHSYRNYLRTDEPAHLASAIDDLSYFLLSDIEIAPTHYLQVSGWAGLPLFKVKFIELHSSIDITRVKPKNRREDVSSFYGYRKVLRCGFETKVEVGDESEVVEIRIITKGEDSYRLNLHESAKGSIVNQHEYGIHAGSIDTCKRIQISELQQNLFGDEISGEERIFLAEILLTMSLYEECARIFEQFSDVPQGADRRIDRVRYILKKHWDTQEEIELYVHSTRLLDPGGLNKVPTAKCVLETDVHIHSGSLLIDSNNKFIVADRAARPEYDFVSGQWDIAIGSNSRLHEVQVASHSLPTLQIERAVSLLGRNPENYFHSLIEYLPRYFTAKNSEYLKDHLFLLNSESPATIKFAAESLIPKERIKYISKKDSIFAKELLIPTLHTQTYDSTHIPWEYSGQMDWRPIEQFSQRMLDLHLGGEPKCPDVFAIRTGGLRSIPNAKKLIRIAQDEGFEILDLAKLTFVEQLTRLYWSRRVVIPGGSGLAGMIFMRPGTSVLALATAEQQELGSYKAIAQHSKVGLEYLLGRPIVTHHGQQLKMNQIHSSFVISPYEFKKSLRSL
jgi:capsular polysaccharide biosynthesis protein